MSKPGYEHFDACDTASDDVCLIAFTSGTTGEPKGTMHFHRDMLATVRLLRRIRAAGLARRPLHRLAAARLHLRPRRPWCCSRCASARPRSCSRRRAAGRICSPAIEQFKATVCFTAPTAYRAMLAKLPKHDISSLRICVSAGETLPKVDIRGLADGDRHQGVMDGIGAPRCCTSSSARRSESAGPGSTGMPVPGYEGHSRRRQTATRCRAARSAASPCAARPAAAISPTRARRNYVQNGWNFTGDTYLHGCRRLFLVPGALRRHDHLGRLQHRRSGGRRRRCSRIRPSPNAAWSVRPTRIAVRSSRPIVVLRAGQTAMRR